MENQSSRNLGAFDGGGLSSRALSSLQFRTRRAAALIDGLLGHMTLTYSTFVYELFVLSST